MDEETESGAEAVITGLDYRAAGFRGTELSP